MKKALLSFAFIIPLIATGCGGNVENKHEHVWSEPTYVWNEDYSTCTVKRVCLFDSTHVEEETIASSYQVVSAPSSEDDDGLGIFVASFTNTAFQTQVQDVVIESDGTKWRLPTYTWALDHSTCTAERISIDNPEVKETETKPSTYTLITPAKCLTDGLEEYVVEFSNEDFTTQAYRNVLDATGHNMSYPTYQFSPNYLICYAKRHCLNGCGYEEHESVWTSMEITKKPALDEEGIGRRWARFKNSAFRTQWHDVAIEKTKYVAEPVFTSSSKGDTVTYGIYPQVRVTRDELITELEKLTPNSNGYVKYNDVYYASIIARPYNNYSQTFDNLEPIVEGHKYWFRCDPIEWNVLYIHDDQRLIVSKHILDYKLYTTKSRAYDEGDKTIYPTNYRASDLRAFLNDTVYDKAFIFDNKHVKSTMINNSAETTKKNPNEYVCENTYDKLFLLSYKDYLNADYGFSTTEDASETRLSKVTEYARAKGVLYGEKSSEEHKFNGWYWTRSPYNNWSVSCIRYTGEITNGIESAADSDWSGSGIRPAMILW